MHQQAERCPIVHVAMRASIPSTNEEMHMAKGLRDTDCDSGMCTAHQAADSDAVGNTDQRTA